MLRMTKERMPVTGKTESRCVTNARGSSNFGENFIAALRRMVPPHEALAASWGLPPCSGEPKETGLLL